MLKMDNEQKKRLETDAKRLKQQLDFILEIDKEKNVFRQTRLSGLGRRENDAEHAWHMAIMVYLLNEYSNEKIDLARTMMMCLIHDIVEIDAGDTFAYDEEGKKTQKEREEKAAKRIFGILPDDQKEILKELFREFEEQKTPEARFTNVMDNMQPLLLNVSNEGADWIEHGIHKEQVMGRNARNAEGSALLADYILKVLDEQKNKGRLL